MKKIYLFTMNGCDHCRSLKKRLDELDISYTNVDIFENKDLWEQVVNQTKSEYVPVVFIKEEGSEEGNVYIPEKDFKTEEEIIEIIKNNI